MSDQAMKDSGKNRDSNDEKTMVNSPGNMPGREIDVSRDTLNNTMNSPIMAYYEFPSSKTMAMDTYSKRMPALVDALGNKDSVKG